MGKAMRPLYAALILNLAYLGFRWMSMFFNWFGPGDFLWKMPVFPLLIVLPVLQFFVVQHFMRRLEMGELNQTSFFSAFKEAAKMGLISAVFVSASIWLYYSFLDKTYLPTSIAYAINEAAAGGLAPDQLKGYSQTISTFNQPNLRSVFTLSGLTVFGMLSAWPAAFFAVKLRA